MSASSLPELPLAARLTGFLSGRGDESVQAAVWSRGRIDLAGAGPHRDDGGAYADPDYRCLPGCIAKMMTATVAARAIAESRCDLDAECTRLLEVTTAPLKDLLSGIRLRHLLDHSSGLDDSAVETVSFDRRGFIDWQELLSPGGTISKIAPAGEQFHYGRIGSWLVAAIVERLCGKRFVELLFDGIMGPATGQVADGSGLYLGDGSSRPAFCPADGGDNRLPIATILRFACSHLPSHGAAAGEFTRILRENVLQSPGWFPSERRICLGLSDYGGGWFGHNSVYRGSSLVLRFNPERDIAIVVAGNRRGSARAALDVIAPPEPGSLAPAPPPLLSRKQWQGCASHRYRGIYLNAGRRFEILNAGDTLLLIESHPADTAGKRCALPLGHSLLRPAEGHVFFPVPGSIEGVSFLQFLDPQDGGTFRYLQNGKHVFRRAGNSDVLQGM